jgi:hypothetical protein
MCGIVEEERHVSLRTLVGFDKTHLEGVRLKEPA